MFSAFTFGYHGKIMQLYPFVLAVGLFISSLSIHASPVELQKQFVDLMVKEHQFSREEVESTLAKANKNQAILASIAKPWEAKPWYQYYPIFLTEKRLKKGVKFWQSHQQTLARAELESGVPAEIIVAIIGVETFYGTYQGKYSVLDALVTLGFHYPSRATFFRSELAQLFLLAKEENFDITALKGSYAGAMGWGQFIPSSYRHYAVDFNGDGVRDLLNSPADAIGSVANYFKMHGWKPGQPVTVSAIIADDVERSVANKKLKPRLTVAELKNKGYLPSRPIEVDQVATAMLLQGDGGEEAWLGLHNFYVISRYNHSKLYAMAVYQLSETF